MRYPYVKIPSYEEMRTNPQAFRLPTDADVRNYLIAELQEAHLFANGRDIGDEDRERWQDIGDEVVAQVIGDDEIMAAVKSLAVSLVLDRRRELHDAFCDRMARELAEELETEMRELLAGDGGSMRRPTVDDAHLAPLVKVLAGVGGGTFRDDAHEEEPSPEECVVREEGEAA